MDNESPIRASPTAPEPRLLAVDVCCEFSVIGACLVCVVRACQHGDRVWWYRLSIVVITGAGLVAGAVASTSSSIVSYILFSAPILLPLSAVLLFNEQMETRGIGVLVVVFFVITLRQVRRINGVLQESIINGLELEKSKEKTEKLAKELYQLSTMDALTSITNRRGFNEALSQEWLRAKRSNTPLTSADDRC